jgi:hypothetical protein
VRIDLVDGKSERFGKWEVVAWGHQYIVIQNDAQKYRIEFSSFAIKELKSKCNQARTHHNWH